MFSFPATRAPPPPAPPSLARNRVEDSLEELSSPSNGRYRQGWLPLLHLMSNRIQGGPRYDRVTPSLPHVQLWTLSTSDRCNVVCPIIYLCTVRMGSPPEPTSLPTASREIADALVKHDSRFSSVIFCCFYFFQPYRRRRI
jgi:hypothetical protein